MMFIKSNILAAMLGASAASAHMIMSSPTPYSKDSLNNSPLAADGSDFPCKLRDNAFEAPATETVIGIGESHPLTFVGSATHGGGSCQISLTTDLQPSKDSEWKVIKSFEGGCPANVDGNLSGGAEAADPDTFSFKIPEGIAAGKYTLAWTWFNRIGNREMYMNCAPITVSGSSSKRSVDEDNELYSNNTQVFDKRSSSFPPLFVANVNGCTTKEGVDIRFPQPGDYVEFLGEAANLAAEGSEACTGTATFGGAGDTSSGSSSDSGSSGSSSSVVASAPSATASVSVAPAPVATPSSVPEVPAAGSSGSGSGSGSGAGSSATQAAPASPTPSTGGSTTSSGTLTGACSAEGQWNCIAGSSFQRCANGSWSASQQMAAGTQCGAGLSSDLSITATMQARHISAMRFRKRHVGGHHA
ncbi:uncharacterized protein N7511_000209 [Penicillium nucicola]|uniref:uncharacterized protein n=1 Tax=Penicillium nucicola TaxID=1850975 RepID=UPI00254580AF|nr:uncharacterized protein N7511_000209 [Penicillium nucicola]KAJ5775198.1 hypothetical protein N7511_000209 [Penicillium nucicola]